MSTRKHVNYTYILLINSTSKYILLPFMTPLAPTYLIPVVRRHHFKCPLTSNPSIKENAISRSSTVSITTKG